MSKVYVILTDECYNSDSYVSILGTYATKELAKKEFDAQVKAFESEENGYDTEEKSEDRYEAYNEGWWSEAHYAISIHEQEVETDENNMTIEIEDVNLVDDATATGGKANASETLAQFIGEVGENHSLAEINQNLVECGIEPITDEQIIVKGVK